MSAELSAMMIGLEKEAVSIASTGRTHAQTVADRLAGRVTPPEGQPAIDFLAFQLSLVQMVEDGLEQIHRHDESLVDELDEDREKLAERNDTTEELTTTLDAVQSACDGVYGTEASRRLFGNVEILPTDPRKLRKLGKRVHRRLDDPEYPLPQPQLKGWKLDDRQALADEVGASVDRLDLALKDLSDERKASQGTRVFKAGVVEDFRRTNRYVAGSLSSLYGLAGMEDLAAGIRPKRRRRRRGEGGDGEEGAGGGGREAAGEAPAESQENGGDVEPVRPPGPTLVTG